MRNSSNNYKGVEPCIINQVKYHARKLIYYLHDRMEIEDVEQELLLDVLKRLRNYDPKKSCLNTFIDRILNHRVATIIEEIKAEKRGGGKRGESLEELEENVGEFPDYKSDNDDYIGNIFLIIDMSRARNYLPQSAAMLFDYLQIFNPSELAQLIGVPRGTLYESINELRYFLRKKRLHHYL